MIIVIAVVLLVSLGPWMSKERAEAAETEGKKQNGSELMRDIQRIGNNVGREISKAASAGAEAVNKAVKKAKDKADK